MSSGSELLVIGGRSGVGKTTVAHSLHALLRIDDVRHALIEGDNLDLAWPPPWQDRLSFRNLSAVWANYRELGYRRLIYTNTVAVLEARELAAALHAWLERWEPSQVYAPKLGHAARLLASFDATKRTPSEAYAEFRGTDEYKAMMADAAVRLSPPAKRLHATVDVIGLPAKWSRR